MTSDTELYIINILNSFYYIIKKNYTIKKFHAKY